MRWEIESREPERDPALADALREIPGDAQLSDADFERLRLRIRAGAESIDRSNTYVQSPGPATPARRRFPRPVVALPALLAAALAGILLVRGQGQPPVPPSPAPVVQAAPTAEQALQVDVSDAEFARLVSGADDPAALLRIAVAEGSAPARR